MMLTKSYGIDKAHAHHSKESDESLVNKSMVKEDQNDEDNDSKQ